MNTFRLVVSSPDGEVLCTDNAVTLSLRADTGDIAVMAGHIPIITAVKPCHCRLVYDDGTVLSARINGGFLAVNADSTTLLTDTFTAIEKAE